MSLLKKISLAVSVMGAAFLMTAAPINVYAAEGIQQNLCAGINLDVTSNCSTGGVSGAEAQERINSIIKNIINFLSLIVGVISVIMIIIGGLRYITSGGDSSNVTSAKNTILYAIIGLIIVALSQFIVRFVLSKVIIIQ